MRILDVGKLTVGSCVVYFVIAACSSYGDEDAKHAATPPTTSSDGATTTSVIDPVPNALADGFKSGTRLKLEFYEGADGAKQFIDFFDTELMTSCTVQRTTPDNKWRCVPGSLGSVYYSDILCQVPAFVGAYNTTDPQPTVAVESGKENGGGASAFYKIGALVTPPAKIYSRFKSEQCDGFPPNATENYYTLGVPLTTAAFVEMTIKHE